MPYVSIVQVTIKAGHGEQVERAIEPVFALGQAWLQSGDLLASRLIRATNGVDYTLVSSWKDRAAHNRHEEDPEEQKLLAAIAGAIAAPPREFRGDVIARIGGPSRWPLRGGRRRRPWPPLARQRRANDPAPGVLTAGSMHHLSAGAGQ